MIDFLDWLARIVGVVAALAAAGGLFFREALKHALHRWASRDLERFKAELSRESAVHAASLAPQLEQVKLEFQQKMEAYKVSLIAETEAVKARGELRKAIATKYAANRFDRLVDLESHLAPLATFITSRASWPPQVRGPNDVAEALAVLEAFRTAQLKAGMYLSPVQRNQLTTIQSNLFDIVEQYIGPKTAPMPEGTAQEKAVMLLCVQALAVTREQIAALAEI